MTLSGGDRPVQREAPPRAAHGPDLLEDSRGMKMAQQEWRCPNPQERRVR
jgi:hypothetical protein